MAVSQQQLTELYLAYFGRPPDFDGMVYYTSNPDFDIWTVAAGFSASPESQALYGTGGTASMINAIYQNLFNRDAELDGLLYWSGEIASGRLTAAGAAYAILLGAQNEDKVSVDNKLAVSAAFVAAMDTPAEIMGYAGNAAAATARAFLATVDSTPDSLTAGMAGVDAAVAATVGLGGTAGQTFTLTNVKDTIVGTNGNDTIEAYASKGSLFDETTINNFDSIDGGAGIDTMNIYVGGPNQFEAAFANTVQQGTIKNVEIINIFNSNAVNFGGEDDIDASGFQGATQIWQTGGSNDVKNVAGGTTVGFRGAVDDGMEVRAAATATNVSIALDAADPDSSDFDIFVAGNALSTVTVSGNTALDEDGERIELDLNINSGLTVQTLTVNSFVEADTRLRLDETGGATKEVTTLNLNMTGDTVAQIWNLDGLKTVNASGSTGGIFLQGEGSTLSSITTGSGDDEVDLRTTFTASVLTASVSTGAGDDDIEVEVSNWTNDVKGAVVNVDGGAGDDTIYVNVDHGEGNRVKINLTGGAGDDRVTLAGGFTSITTSDLIDGGADFDTIVGDGKTVARIADDYITLTKVVTNFEELELTSAEGAAADGVTAEIALDASQLTSYKSFVFTGSQADTFIKSVAADQMLTVRAISDWSDGADLTATAKGYVSKDTAVTSTTYAGTLNVVTELEAWWWDNEVDVTARADTLNLTVTASDTGWWDGSSSYGAVLHGDVKTAVVTLNNGADLNDDDEVLHDNIAWVAITTDVAAVSANKGSVGAFTELGGLTSLTLQGNGEAYVVNGNKSALVTVNASALGGTYQADFDGFAAGSATYGLFYTSSNASAETVTLGSGIDELTILASTYGKADTITGLNLVLNGAGTALAATSDSISINSGVAFKKFTTTQTDLDLALKDAAASAVGDNLVFTAGGNTYIYVDAGDAGLVDAADTVVKLTGTIDLDALIVSLAPVL